MRPKRPGRSHTMYNALFIVAVFMLWYFILRFYMCSFSFLRRQVRPQPSLLFSYKVFSSEFLFTKIVISDGKEPLGKTIFFVSQLSMHKANHGTASVVCAPCNVTMQAHEEKPKGDYQIQGWLLARSPNQVPMHVLIA